MANYTELIARIQLLEENVIMPISGTGGGESNILKDFDPNNFTTTFDLNKFETNYDNLQTSQFHAPTIQTTSDLSVYLNSLAPKEGSIVESKPRHPFPVTPGVPILFFKDMFAEMPPQLNLTESYAQIQISPESQPNLAQTLISIEPGSTIFLSPGIYDGNYIIRQDITIRSNGNAFFDSAVTSILVEDGNVAFEGIAFRKGSAVISGGRVQFTSCKFSAQLVVKGTAVVSCRDTIFKCSNDYCVSVEETGNFTMIESSVEEFGIYMKSGNTNVLKSKLEAIQGSSVVIEGGIAFFEETSIGDCTDSAIRCLNRCQVTITNCSVYDSEKNLVNASRGAIVKIKGGSFTGRCNATVVSSNGAAVSVEDIEIRNPVISNNDALLHLKRCRPVVVFVNASRLVLSECQIIAAPRSGLVSIGFSDLQIESTIFSSCTSNGMELSEETTATIIASQFIQNQLAGALISSTSATIRDCIFDGNNVVGVQISGHNSSPSFDNCTFTNNAITGVTIIDGATPSFSNCQLKQNEKYGAVISKAQPSFLNSEFSINQGIGIEIKGGANPKLETCVFDSNLNFASQISGQGTSAQFLHCSFNKHGQSSAVIIYAKAIALFNSCLFTMSGHCHAEIREEGKGRFEQCVLSESTGGIGLFVHNQGVLEVDSSVLKDEIKTAVFVGNRGQAAIVGSEISNCNLCGIITDLQSTAVIMKNTIRSNGAAGVQVEGGEVRIEGNTIENHTDFGIYSTNVSQVVQEGNNFAQNGKGDTQIA